MPVSVRYFLFPEESDPLRLSQRLVDGLIQGKDAMPQYADTKQRVMGVVIQNEDGKPTNIDRTYGTIWTFDEDGAIREGLQEAVAEAMNLGEASSTSEKVVSIRPQLKRKHFNEKYRWEPSSADIERVVRDIWPKKKTDRLKDVKGVSKRKPALTFDAKHALGKVSGGFWEIKHEIDKLKEPGLRGFTFEARKRASEDLEYRHLYNALAEMAVDRLELLKREKTGKGIWYAVLEVMMTRPEGYSEVVQVFREKCEGRDAAVAATRKMLVQHANLFNDHTDLQASVMTDLEWDVLAYPD
ncbi:hypothetical protein [Rhizobium croatiense]|uniref:hypothetical protein n=1 Tax=Rhizobium croatiense TaxID=2867516 RepID=UPI0023EE1A24|nr:hypothetical protein [Rhizobium croatiense]WET74125.1 hypothetical protein PYR68_00885 [Rhizobium croatiense]